jgi:glutathione S-transferase
MSDLPLTLYGHFESGNVYKPALLLALTRTPYHFEHVDLFAGASRTPEFLAGVSRFGQVPVLRHGEERIAESTVILTYLAELTSAFGGESPAERRRIAEWLAWDNDRLTAGVSMSRFLRRFAPRFGQSPSAEVIQYCDGRAASSLDLLEREIASRPFLIGERPTIADLSCAGYLYWPEQASLDLSRWPSVQRWTERIAALPGWRAPYDLLPRS